MNFYHFIKLNWRSLLIFLIGLVIMMVLFGSRDHKLAWAAPEQNPHLQTIPPRPTETPAPVAPNPTRVGQPATTSEEDNDGDDEEDDDNFPLPTRIPGDGDQTETDPTESSEPDDDDDASSTETSPSEDETKDQVKSSGESSGQESQNNKVPATPQQADLSLIKWVDEPNPSFGEMITLTAIITNSGPSRATNVIAKNLLPPGLILSSTVASRGSYEVGKGLWIISTIGRSEQVTMSWIVRVAVTDPITTTAEVVAVDQFDPDSTPNNHLEIEDDQESVSLIPVVDTSLATQSRLSLIDLGVTPPPTQETLALSNDIDWLYWLFALVIGGVFVIIGIQLVHRS